MTTNYRLSDNLAKDESGAKLLMPIDDSTSQLDFALLRGIGSEPFGATSRNIAFLGVGSHTVGSVLGTYTGALALGAYTETPSAIILGGAQAQRVDLEGALYTRPASGIMSVSSASVETHISGSALLHDIHIHFSDVTAGDDITIEDGDNYRLTFVATAASQHFSEHFSTGLVFNTSIKSTATYAGTGTGSVTIAYSAY